MKKGDIVEMTEHGHSVYKVSAYAGMKGVVTDIYEDGAFAIETETSVLVVPANDAFKNEKKYIDIILNGKKTRHRFIHPKKPSKAKTFFSLLCNILFPIPYNIVKETNNVNA